MKFSTTAVLLAAAIGASAAPSHAHRHMHRSLAARDFVKAVKPAPEPTTTAAPEPTKEPEPEPKPEEVNAVAIPEEKEEKVEEKPSGEGQGPSTYTEFCGGAYRKRATLEEIAYAGNLGTPDNYGCNMMLVKSNIAEEYKYRVKLENAGSSEQVCIAYLKIGPLGLIDGFFSGNQAMDFTIPAGATQWFVADENTQGGIVCQANAIETTQYGDWGSTWAEFDFGNESNNGWSGADASCLTASREGLTIPGMNICGHGTCSTIWPGGKGKNAFTEGMEAEDGWGLNIPAGPAFLDITIDYQG